MLHSRRDCKHAVLDTHILKWLREDCGFNDAPKSTPIKREIYEQWENTYLTIAPYHFDPLLSLADIDLIIWSLKSGRLS